MSVLRVRLGLLVLIRRCLGLPVLRVRLARRVRLALLGRRVILALPVLTGLPLVPRLRLRLRAWVLTRCGWGR